MKWGHSDTTLVVGLTLKFLSQDRDLVTILQCSKTFNEVFRDTVYKQSLLYSSNEMSHAKREHIWSHFLKPTHEVEYAALRDKINANTEIIK